ncbi:P2X purinoceptor 7-like, partial [Saccoglossus kowalevskii]
YNCICEHEEFDFVCLYLAVLRTVLVRLYDLRKEPLTDPIVNRTYRWAAYTQFTYWIYNKLGRNVRRVIPSCVVWAVRKAFPEASEDYTRFKESNTSRFPY